MARLFCYIFVLTLATLAASLSYGQTQAPTDPTLASLQAELAALDAKLKIQQDQQALLTGALPTSSATPNSGAFTVTGSNPFPSQRLAFLELQSVAKTMADKVSTKGPVVVYDQAEIGSLVNYIALARVVTLLQDRIAKLHVNFSTSLDPQARALLTLPKGPSPTKAFAPILAPGLVLSSLKTVSDVIGMFRTNTSIAYSTFSADDAALIASVVAELRAAGKIVYEPTLMPLNPTDESSVFMDKLQAVQDELVMIQDGASLDQANVQQVSDALGAFLTAEQACKANQDQVSAEADKNKKATLKAKQGDLGRVRDVARQYVMQLLGADVDTPLDTAAAITLKAQQDQFLKKLAGFITSTATAGPGFITLQTSLTAISNSGSSPLTAILRAEKLMNVVKQDEVSIMLVRTSALGGSVVTRTNLFTGGHLLFTGGAIANFVLLDGKGAVTASGVVVGSSGRKTETY